MAEKKQCELYLLRVVPHPLRDDFMTVGFVLVEAPSSQQSNAESGAGAADAAGGFVDVRFTRDWKRVECFAPDIEMELYEHLETAVRERLEKIRKRDDLLQVLEGFAPVFDVAPGKGVLTSDPAAEMKVLERDYLAAMEPAERARRLGRLGIVSRMESAFAEAGVLGLLQRDLEMTEFTGENDPFRVDFGFRVGRSVKMFHALALSMSREPAVTLAYRYARIQQGMRKRNEEALLTAVIQEEVLRARGEVASGIAMLRANEIRVRAVEEMAEVAEEVRAEVGGS